MLLSDNYSGDKIKEGEMGRAYGTHGGEELWWGILKEKDILGDVGVNGRLVSEWTSKNLMRDCGLD